MKMKFKLCLVVFISLCLAIYANLDIDDIDDIDGNEPVVLKRAGVLIGGLNKVSPDDEIVPDLIALINEVRFNATDEDENVWFVTETSDIYSQLVSGMKYTLNATLNKTNCLKKDLLAKNVSINELRVKLEESPSMCEAVAGGTPQKESVIIRYSIWSQPWMNRFEITSEEQL